MLNTCVCVNVHCVVKRRETPKSFSTKQKYDQFKISFIVEDQSILFTTSQDHSYKSTVFLSTNNMLLHNITAGDSTVHSVDFK